MTEETREPVMLDPKRDRDAIMALLDSVDSLAELLANKDRLIAAGVPAAIIGDEAQVYRNLAANAANREAGQNSAPAERPAARPVVTGSPLIV